jgi:type IV secretory pathway VirB4 component
MNMPKKNKSVLENEKEFLQQQLEELKKKQEKNFNKRIKKVKKKNFFEKLLRIKNYQIPNSAQRTIPFKNIFDNGMIQVEEDYFAMILSFSNINYTLAREDDQKVIFAEYCKFLNSLETDLNFQLFLQNINIDQDEITEALTPKAKINDPEVKELQDEYFKIIQGVIKESKNKTAQKKLYMVFGTRQADPEKAESELHKFVPEIKAHFKKIDSEVEPLTAMQVIELFHDFYNPHKANFFVEPEEMIKKGMSLKDVICPASFKFEQTYSYMGNLVSQTLFVRDYPNILNDNFITELLDNPFNLQVSMHIDSSDSADAVKYLKRKITSLEGNRIEYQKKNAREGTGYIPYELQTSLKEVTDLLDSIVKSDKKLFFVSLYINIIADNLEQLQARTDTVLRVCRKNLINADILTHQQEDGLVSILPICKNKVKGKRSLLTDVLAVLMPFSSQEIFHKNGFYYGRNTVSGSMIVYNRKNLQNASGFLLGVPGCLMGDTKIKIADGATVTMQHLAENMTDKEFYVYSYDIKNKKVVKAKARHPRVTKHVKELLAVHLSNGEIVKCTPDHNFLKIDGEYIEAQYMLPGDNLMPENKVVKVENISLESPVDVYDIEVDEYENFLLDAGIFVHNSGKSFTAKEEIMSVYFNTDDDIIIIDPENEYSGLCNSLKGEVINISSASENFINPMDLSEDYADDDNPINLKSEFILSLVESIKGKLTAAEKTIIDRCVKLVYADYVNSNFDRSKLPCLKDFYDILCEQTESQAKDILLALEMYIKGSLNLFSHQTNIELNNRLTVFNTKDLGKQLKGLGMLITLDCIWNRVCQNRGKNKHTWIYTDEFYILFDNEYSAQFYYELYKRARKWGGIPTGITQNVEDLLRSETARTMLSNSQFLLLLNQSASDRQEFSKLLKVSDVQLNYVTNADTGSGLLISGKNVIPFKKKFPKDSRLYKVLTTKIGED